MADEHDETTPETKPATLHECCCACAEAHVRGDKAAVKALAQQGLDMLKAKGVNPRAADFEPRVIRDEHIVMHLQNHSKDEANAVSQQVLYHLLTECARRAS